jgi:thiol:disulfide interchange protein DsbC
MLKVLFITLIVIMSVMADSPASAKDGCVGECGSCHKLSTTEAAELLKKTGGTVTSIRQAPISGMFELLMEKDGRQGIIYIDYAKKNFMQGFIVNFETLKKVSAHDRELPQPKLVSRVDPGAIPVEYAVVMGHPHGTKMIYVFTDPDCPYCRQQHVELKKLEKIAPDITINLLPYPLPAHPEAYDKSRVILTIKNRSTLDKAFNGEALPAVGTKDGTRELNEIMNFARRSGITVTPSIVLPDGTVLSGLKSAEELKYLLDGAKQQ